MQVLPFARSVLLPICFVTACTLLPSSSISIGILKLQAADEELRDKPIAAEQSLEQIVLDDEFNIELLTSEPHVIDPVEVAFDDAGKMWVVEMRDYPIRVSDKPRGRIQVLSDEDGDGKFESSRTFADELEMPNGIAHWRDGIVATVAGQLIFLRDTDGDGVADERQVWLEGFTRENEQLRANHPRLGPDGRWYIACGLRGGEVKLGSYFADRTPQTPLTIGSRDVRFDPSDATYELITGPAQFGLCFDPWGNRYFCSNRNPAVEVVFEQPDLEGNPLSGLAPSVIDVMASGAESRVYPLVQAWTTSNLHAGQFTAACGVFLRASQRLLPAPESQINSAHAQLPIQMEVFACEPTGSLVKRELKTHQGFFLQPQASTAAATEEPREWLASKDPWFRPVNVTLAPDGEAIVVDMHRAVIEHPQFVPLELKNRRDGRWGDSAGRIYWVGRSDRLREILLALKKSPLNSRSDEELGKLVADDNPWIRQTAERLLLQRDATHMVAQLMDQATNSKQALLGRMASLRLAAGLTRSIPTELHKILAQTQTQDERALALAALRIARDYPSLSASLAPRLAQLAMDDLTPELQFEALLCLGAMGSASAEAVASMDVDKVLQALIQTSYPQPIIALGSALRNSPEKLLSSWLVAIDNSSNTPRLPITFVAAASRSLTAACMRSQLPTASDSLQPNDKGPEWIEQARQIAIKGRHEVSQLAALACLNEWVRSQEESSALDDGFWSDLAELVSGSQNASQVTTSAIELLGYSPRQDDSRLLKSMIDRASQPTLTPTLLVAWSRSGAIETDQYLIDSLSSASPQILRSLLALIAQKPNRLALLAKQLDAGKITARQIGADELKKLVDRAKNDTQVTLKQHLEQIVNSNRAQVVSQYEPCLALTTDPNRGREVFSKHCASCHRIGDVGLQVGPDISDSRSKLPLQLLSSILDPNLAIDNNYFRFIALTEDDRVVEGMIAEETTETIVLLGQENKREVLRRDEILELKATGISLMPEGLEAQIDPQSMADLIAFIKGWRYLDSNIPAGDALKGN